MSQIETDLPYRQCVGTLVFNKSGQVFAGKRAGFAEHTDDVFEWQMPQGGIDAGEEPYQAAIRELYEETSISSVRLLAEAGDWFSYDLPKEALGIALKGKYRGQTQRWFAFLFEGDDSEINVIEPANGTHPSEFSDWNWRELEDMPGLIVPFKRGVYESVVREFRAVRDTLRAS